MTELFKTRRSARKYLDEHGGVLLDFGTAGAGYAGSFYAIKENPLGRGMPKTEWLQTYAVCEYSEAVEFRQHCGGEKHLDNLIEYDETRQRRRPQK
jgi:hypothetical protein|tara:strand:+ start:585 stop:872 length:288 start_codon:yes stop_codon:yes gene_type:complete